MIKLGTGYGWKYVKWPQPAGDLQASGDSKGLVAEFRSNYATYHEFLARELRLELAKYGGRPRLDQFNGDASAYLKAVGFLQELVNSEALLRALVMGTDGTQAPAGGSAQPPLLGPDDQLLGL